MKKNIGHKEVLMEFPYFLYAELFDGDIKEICETITYLPKKLREAYPLNMDLKKAHRFSIKHDTQYGYDNDSRDIFIFQAYRWETDEEFKNRIELEEKKSIAAKKAVQIRKEAQLKREKTLYENLKNKFDKNKK